MVHPDLERTAQAATVLTKAVRRVAERLGIPGRQVRSQLHRAIKKIREMLQRKNV